MQWREVRTGFKAPDKYIQEQHNKKKKHKMKSRGELMILTQHKILIPLDTVEL